MMAVEQSWEPVFVCLCLCLCVCVCMCVRVDDLKYVVGYGTKDSRTVARTLA